VDKYRIVNSRNCLLPFMLLIHRNERNGLERTNSVGNISIPAILEEQYRKLSNHRSSLERRSENVRIEKT